MSDTHLMVWSIGPVQDFIAAGRKGRDLWFGSWLLSELARAAAQTIELDKLVHPYADKKEALADPKFNVSNKILIKTKNPQETATKLEEAARKRLMDLARKALEPHKGLLEWETVLVQIEDLPEFYWAAAPINGDFAQARKVAEALHAGAKAHRRFSQPPWDSGVGVPKSSLDSSRESVIHEDFYNEKKKHLLKRFSVQGKERLCGVSLLKRMGHTVGEGRGWVMSTSHVASWTMRQSWAKERHLPEEMVSKLREAVDAYVEVLELDADLTRAPRPDPVLGHWDGHILFENRLGDLIDDPESLNAAKQANRRFVRTIGKIFEDYQQPKPKNPTPYYAILVADGDRVGAAIDKLSEGVEGEKNLQRFTVELEGFTTRAREVIARHHGHAIYTGGDDVLAILPLELALSCANELREDFVATMRPLVKDLLEGENAIQPPTLSVGIAIGHHTSPLQGTLDQARTAEKKAKQTYKRNAWCIILDKRSGVPLEIGGGWDEYPAFEAIYKLYREDKLPRGLPYDLRAAGQRLTLSKHEEQQESLKAQFQAMRAAEARRILAQKKVENATLSKQSAGGDLEKVANRLQMARFLTDPEEER